MPIHVAIPTRRLSQAEFGEIAYRVMDHAFAVHNEFGRFFDEWIYRNELAERVDGGQVEVPITVSHRTFKKQYFIDMLVSEGGLFELKCVENIHPRHRAQVTSYLLMCDLAHGKIINFRPSQVEHEFVNCTTRLADLTSPRFVHENWNAKIHRLKAFATLLRDLISDWGVGLGTDLYSEAVSYFMGEATDVFVGGSKRQLGTKAMSLIAPNIAFKFTGLSQHLDEFRIHTKRLLQHTSLEYLAWANLTIGEVRLELISRA